MSTAVAPIIAYAPTRPLDVQPNLRQVSRGSCTICSIWPQALQTKRIHNGVTIYKIPAAPRGSYVTYTVYDTQQWINRPREDRYQGDVEPHPIPARTVAECLVATWGGSTLGAKSGNKPGIDIIEGDEPTAKELATLRDGQSAMFHFLITEAMGMHIDGKGVLISDMHRMAAKEMLDKGAERLPWFPVHDFAAVKNCVACGKQINQNALRCEHCTTMLPQFYIEFGLTPENDPAVSDFIARIRASKPEAPKPVAPPVKFNDKEPREVKA